MMWPTNQPAPPELPPEWVRALLAIGFHATLNGQPGPALRVFEGLSVLRPQAAFPCVGRGLALVASGRSTEAAQVLEQGMTMTAQDEHGNGDTIRVFLGLALRLARREHHARAVLTAVAESAQDAQAQRLARHLLDHPS